MTKHDTTNNLGESSLQWVKVPKKDMADLLQRMTSGRGLQPGAVMILVLTHMGTQDNYTHRKGWACHDDLTTKSLARLLGCRAGSANTTRRRVAEKMGLIVVADGLLCAADAEVPTWDPPTWAKVVAEDLPKVLRRFAERKPHTRMGDTRGASEDLPTSCRRLADINGVKGNYISDFESAQSYPYSQELQLKDGRDGGNPDRSTSTFADAQAPGAAPQTPVRDFVPDTPKGDSVPDGTGTASAVPRPASPVGESGPVNENDLTGVESFPSTQALQGQDLTQSSGSATDPDARKREAISRRIVTQYVCLVDQWPDLRKQEEAEYVTSEENWIPLALSRAYAALEDVIVILGHMSGDHRHGRFLRGRSNKGYAYTLSRLLDPRRTPDDALHKLAHPPPGLLRSPTANPNPKTSRKSTTRGTTSNPSGDSCRTHDVDSAVSANAKRIAKFMNREPTTESKETL